MEKSLIECCEHYFKLFSAKNIEELSKLFSDDIELRDWAIWLLAPNINI